MCVGLQSDNITDVGFFVQAGSEETLTGCTAGTKCGLGDVRQGVGGVKMDVVDVVE